MADRSSARPANVPSRYIDSFRWPSASSIIASIVRTCAMGWSGSMASTACRTLVTSCGRVARRSQREGHLRDRLLLVRAVQLHAAFGVEPFVGRVLDDADRR